MKKAFLAIALCGLVFISCKKETVVEETTIVSADGTTVTTTKTTTDYDVMRLKKAEDDYKAAENDIVVAREKGDTEAERAAQAAADKAKSAWEITKREVREGAQKTNDALKEAGQDVKEGYNKTLEKAKAK